MIDYHRIAATADAALAETQVVDGIEHIGLAHSIVAGETINLGRKLQIGFRNILIVQY